ncbi:MAG: RnfABCDGE type electron transport complex subunit G [Prolixibacteraceae bacterium]|jgi:electron transport complex protein RnfG|nr:RnfABCDGE type electron transport complex subunit G [Prolixibacteraceae bacterium]NLX27913.1 RnfABCDGE type electron transport complex subunit G [Bacteroidales bacterium]HNQ36317.1 RnfABCDGE type electron transport complex subunit G [Prolixibacteraceae bacterium]HPJ77516.1 RnfABCDGE type electron transport complex subunit G [Prolixibacteraceae bacterium]HRV88192.1 RnfABCDGE type electron transport complex subunit G [Prolixibacteraceae bacterium]
MKQRESTFINMVGALLVVTLVSGALLGFVHQMTKSAIDLAREKAQSDAIASVLPPFDELAPTLKVLPEEGADSIEIFPALAQGHIVGYAVKSYSNNGFSGFISVMAGVDTLGNFTGYEVLEHKETPGLGSKMGDWFRNKEKEGQNVIGKSPGSVNFTVSKDGGDIDAITASTITSRAFLEALRRAHQGVTTLSEKNHGE